MNSPTPPYAPLPGASMTAVVAGGGGLGTSIAILVHWYLVTFRLKQPIPAEVTIAMGSVISIVVTVWWHIFSQIFQRYGISVAPNSES